MSSSIRTALRAVAALLVLACPTLALGTLITFIHVNDSHSHLEATGPKDAHLDGTLGGIAKAATVIGTLEATAPNPILVHAGDLFQEDLFFYAALGPQDTPLLSVPELELLAGLNLAVMAVGNHELVFGPGALADFLAGARAYLQSAGLSPPDVLSANLDLEQAGLSGLVVPNVVKEVGGVKVGLFGLTIRDATSQSAPFLGTTPDELAAIARTEVAALRGLGAQAVVCLSHLGLTFDEYLAAQVSGLDAIVGGHDHLIAVAPEFVLGPDGKEVPIVRAGAFYKWVGKLTLSVENGAVSFHDYQLYTVDAHVQRTPAVAAAVRALESGIDALYGEDLWHAPIAFAPLDVAKDVEDSSPWRDSGMGDLLTDAYRFKTGTDLALTVNGFFTEDLVHGLVVRDDAFRIVGDGFDPFAPWDSTAHLGFPLYRIALDGQNLMTALATAVALGGDYFVQVSGMRYVMDSRTDPPSLVAAYVHGKPVDPARVYTATVNLGVLTGLAQFPNVALAGEPTLAGVDEFTAVSDYVSLLKVLLYFPQGRVLDLAKL
ncbi:MAG TPA: 5'-nucleotidase C-terminal domain-containing protein [Anaeromyxobacteraceae bacterium]|nr:5'-nucleotidase C-terminal domain-containing protein [Anaeromyxobacteraceae bacterium]